IDVTVILEVGVAGHAIFDDRDERAQGGDPVCPALLVMDGGRPGIELLRRVEATGKLVDGRHEHTPQVRLFPWNEIADKHVLAANALFDRQQVTRRQMQSVVVEMNWWVDRWPAHDRAA